MEKLGNPAVGHSNHVVRNASGDLLKLEGELECQVCLGNWQISTKYFITEQPGSDLMGFNWLGEIGLLNRIIYTIAEDQSLTSLAILTEGALK